MTAVSLAPFKTSVVIYEAVDGKEHAEFRLQYPSDVDFSPDGVCVALGSWKAGEIREMDDEGIRKKTAQPVGTGV